MSKKITAVLLSFLISGYLLPAQDTISTEGNGSSLTLYHPMDQDDIEAVPADDNYDFIKDQLSCIENEIPLNYNVRVHAFVNYFTVRERDFIKKILKRKDLYFPTFEKYLKKYNLPDELKYLAVIESGLNASAYSSATAVGLWQFMSYTGRSYGLHQDAFIDERMDFEMATDAACRHLKQLHNMFGDWELAIAAYNTGPGNVRKAMRRSGKRNFWDIYPYLYRETRAYLPQYVAVTYVMNYLEDYNFTYDIDRQYMPEFDTIMVKDYTHLPTLAAQLGLCEEDIEIMNPGIRHGALPEANKRYPIRIPAHLMDSLLANRDSILLIASNFDREQFKKLASNSTGSTYGKDKIVYRVRSGDVLGTIAARYKVRVSDLKRWNGLSGDMIRVGQRLDIWLKPGSFKPSENVAKNAPKKSTEVITQVDKNGIKTYVVQPGDTLWDISKKFNDLSIEKIKQLNNLKTDNIKPGQKLKVS